MAHLEPVIKNAIGAARTRREDWPEDELRQRSFEMLYRVLNLRTTVAFVGAGMSAPFGYPTWSGLVEIALKSAINSLGPSDTKTERERRKLEELLAETHNGTSGNEFWLYALGAAQEVLEKRTDGRDAFAELAASFRKRGADGAFWTGECDIDKVNPIKALLDLPIRRIVTSNYDCEIEYWWSRLHQESPIKSSEPHLAWSGENASVELSQWPVFRDPMHDPEARHVRFPDTHQDAAATFDAMRSFTQLPDYNWQLAELVLSDRHPDGPPMVFHCHGRCDDPASLVVTERDYQRWYLDQHDPDRRSYRQTIELLLGSNPILFVGFSLDDQDLVRFLRVFSASEPQQKASRPLFALIPQGDRSPNQLIREAEFQYQRHGVHVIWYPSSDVRGDELSRTEAFHRSLVDLKDEWKKWQHDWRSKPKLRELEIEDRKVFVQNEIDPVGTDELAPARQESDLKEIHQRAVNGDRVIVLLGDGGTGKSHRAAEMVGDAKTTSSRPWHQSYEHRFLWSSYYSDDWTTGCDLAIKFLQNILDRPIPNDRRGRFEKFEYLLARIPALLVFDGFERLLEQTPDPEVGRPYTASIHRFLEIVRKTEPSLNGDGTGDRATVILTSRLWPESFGKLAPTAGKHNVDCRQEKGSAATCDIRVHPYRVARLSSDDVARSVLPDNEIKRSNLCSLLGGHAYGLRIAKSYLKAHDDQDAALDQLLALLERTPELGRVSRMIGESIRLYCTPPARRTVPRSYDPDVARAFLSRIAVFMRPVDEATLAACLELATEEVDGNVERARYATFTNPLVRQHLLLAISGRGRWTLHPLVRGYVFQRIHHADSSELPNFSIPGFTTGSAPVDPGSREVGDMIVDLVHALIDKSRHSHVEGHRDQARLYCRAAFSVMRSRMEGTTAARWTSYDKYIRHGIRLLNTAKLLAGDDRWMQADHPRHAECSCGVLYAEELAWLYNEIGLVCCCEGAMFDAAAMWAEGYEINKLIEHGEEAGQFVVQSKLHFSHTYMELGNIVEAERHLKETDAANHRLNNRDFKGRIIGYRGLLAHLRGNTRDAHEHYLRANRLLRETKNRRAEAVFLRHHADLAILLKQLDKAEDRLRVTLSIAETDNLPDLLAYVRTSKGHLHRVREEYGDARHEYEAALSAARQMGIRRLEADVLSELSRLALDQGDSETARVLAMKSMRIANELGLGLRQCHGMVVLGIASNVAGQRDLALGYLNLGYRLSRKRGYWLRASEAETHLRHLGEPPRNGLA